VSIANSLGAVTRGSGSRRTYSIWPFPAGLGYVTGSLVLIAFVLAAPAVYGFFFSLYQIVYMVPTRFVGLQNDYNLFTSSEMGEIIVRSAFFTFCAVAITIATALAIAVWIDSLSPWLGLTVQILVMIPWIISHVVGALLFRWVFANDIGFGAYFLESMGIYNVRPLEDGTVAVILLIAYACWRTLGFAILMFLAGLKGIPADLYEAAEVDGASPWQSFRRITLPMLKTPMMITLVMLTVSNLNNVEVPLIVTGGGPAGATNILPLELYMRAFERFDFNAAMPLGIIVFVVNILFAVIYVRLVKSNG
jgi:ABC-type sugar transport system permease subunit